MEASASFFLGAEREKGKAQIFSLPPLPPQPDIWPHIYGHGSSGLPGLLSYSFSGEPDVAASFFFLLFRKGSVVCDAQGLGDDPQLVLGLIIFLPPLLLQTVAFGRSIGSSAYDFFFLFPPLSLPLLSEMV